MKTHTTIFLSLLFIVLAFPKSFVNAESVPYPEPPSQETLDRLQRLGDENLRKYGSGSGVSPVVTVAPTPISTPEPTFIPTPSPVIASDEALVQQTEIPQDYVEKKWYIKIWKWVSKWF